MINRSATIRWKGYDPNDLTKGSRKKVWAVCDDCGKGRWSEFHQYRELCPACSTKGERNPFYNKHHTQEQKDKWSIDRKGVKLTESHIKKITKNHARHMLGKHHTEEAKNKNRIAHLGKPSGMKGKHHTEETREKMRVPRPSILGENNPNYGKGLFGEANGNWNGGVSSEDEIFRGSPEYKKWRIGVFERDNYTCKECDIRGGDLNAHHILPYRDWKEPRFSLNIKNGITLCEECHRKTFANEYEFFNKYFDIANGVGM